MSRRKTGQVSFHADEPNSPRLKSCQAASQPARPPPIIMTGGHYCRPVIRGSRFDHRRSFIFMIFLQSGYPEQARNGPNRPFLMTIGPAAFIARRIGDLRRLLRFGIRRVLFDFDDILAIAGSRNNSGKGRIGPFLTTMGLPHLSQTLSVFSGSCGCTVPSGFFFRFTIFLHSGKPEQPRKEPKRALFDDHGLAAFFTGDIADLFLHRPYDTVRVLGDVDNGLAFRIAGTIPKKDRSVLL